MTLTLLGTTIETTSFDAPDVDEPPTAADPSVPLYNKSVQAFLRSAMRVNPAVQVELPTRENAFIYAEWYFITVASFMPLLHKPTFMKLVSFHSPPGPKPFLFSFFFFAVFAQIVHPLTLSFTVDESI
ncbi:hypothetical protein J3459_015827 [Metarhizium acridum]|nr:hypothetical protein J3459_015827 [Metarhizium acridum]